MIFSITEPNGEKNETENKQIYSRNYNRIRSFVYLFNGVLPMINEDNSGKFCILLATIILLILALAGGK